MGINVSTNSIGLLWFVIEIIITSIRLAGYVSHYTVDDGRIAQEKDDAGFFINTLLDKKSV